MDRVSGEQVAADTEGATNNGNDQVHEFISLDGVIDAPTWTFDYGFDPAMGQDIGNLMSSCKAILLGRNTYEMFSWPGRPGRLRRTPVLRL